jgi:FkbM family methyltransferase
MLDKIRAFNRSRLINRIKNKAPVRTPHGFNFIGPVAMLQGEFERDETNFLISKLTSCTSFLNIGANYGYYCCHAQKLGVKTVAIEPVPINCGILMENMKINGWGDNITLLPIAAGNNSGFIDIYGEGTGASIIRGWARNPNSLSATVSIAKVDEIINPSALGEELLVLIDVEGFEYNVLLGAEKLISSNNKKITWLIEILLKEHSPNKNRNYVDTFNIFFKEGYKAFDVNELSKEILIDDVLRWVETGSFEEANNNFVFHK